MQLIKFQFQFEVSLAQLSPNLFLIIVKSPTYPQHNGWVLRENEFAYHPTHPPPTQTQCHQYLSCYWSNFDENLKVASWEDLEQFSTIMQTFVQVIFVQVTFVHIRYISAVIDPILMKL